jgi:hypothetical protein
LRIDSSQVTDFRAAVIAVFERAATTRDVAITKPLMARAVRTALACVLDHYAFGLIDA